MNSARYALYSQASHPVSQGTTDEADDEVLRLRATVNKLQLSQHENHRDKKLVDLLQEECNQKDAELQQLRAHVFKQEKHISLLTVDLSDERKRAQEMVKMLREQWSRMQDQQKEEMDLASKALDDLAAKFAEEKKELQSKIDKSLQQTLEVKLQEMKDYASLLRDKTVEQERIIEAQANRIDSYKQEIREARSRHKRHVALIRSLKEKKQSPFKYKTDEIEDTLSDVEAQKIAKYSNESKESLVATLRRRIENEAAAALLNSQRQMRLTYENKIKEARAGATIRENRIKLEVEKLRDVVQKLLVAKAGLGLNELAQLTATSKLREGGGKNSESEQDNVVQQNMIEGTGSRKSAASTPVEDKSSKTIPKNSSGAREEIPLSKLGSVGDILERAKAASKTRRSTVSPSRHSLDCASSEEEKGGYYLSDGQFYSASSSSDEDESWFA